MSKLVGNPAAVKSRPYHHGNLRCALVDAARALVMEREGPAFSLRDLALAAGVSHNAIYRHFRDRDEILVEIAREGFALLKSMQVSAAAEIDDSKARLVSFARVHVTFALEHRAYYRVMFGPEIGAARKRGIDTGPDGPDTLAMVEAEIARVRNVSRGPETSDDAVLFWSSVHGVATLTLANQFREVCGLDAMSLALRLADKIGATAFGRARVMAGTDGPPHVADSHERTGC
jgi:AcrR family transcriptional regulator